MNTVTLTETESAVLELARKAGLFRPSHITRNAAERTAFRSLVAKGLVDKYGDQYRAATRPGRPVLDEEERRSELIKVRVTPAEKLAVAAHARSKGATEAELIRARLADVLGAPKKGPPGSAA